MAGPKENISPDLDAWVKLSKDPDGYTRLTHTARIVGLRLGFEQRQGVPPKVIEQEARRFVKKVHKRDGPKGIESLVKGGIIKPI